jgi:hypothetical protein
MKRSKEKTLSGRGFDSLSDAEKESIDRDIERVSALTPGRPLTRAERQLHDRAKRKVGRPRVGEGAAKIRISLERGLLRRADRWAAARDLNRSEVIAAALRSLLRDAA